MNIVITMAGASKRFRDAGYSSPKYRLMSGCHSMFHWSLLSLKQYFNSNRFVFVVKEEDNARSFIEEECRILGIANITICELNYQTNGQAETVLATKCLLDNGPLMVYNIDTHIVPNSLPEIPDGCNGWIPCVNLAGDHWSFVKENGNGSVQVVEKERISDNATIGLYYFKSFDIFHELFNLSKNTNIGEHYIAPLYSMLDNVSTCMVDASLVKPMGTPDEYNLFTEKTQCGMCGV